MKKSIWLAGLAMLAAGGTIWLLGDGEKPIDIGEVKIREAVAVAVLDGACGEKASADCIQTIDEHGKCLCYTDKVNTAEVANALDDKVAEAKDLYSFMLCDKGNTLWKHKAEPVPLNCQVLVDDLLTNVSTGFKGKLEAALEALCAPCKISDPYFWGPCPQCLDENVYPGGCAEACAKQVEE